ncbi:hypothetical protein CFHF_11500 [Caulobacter flavus]|uniref:DUF4410 domain-containing protein n=1 Tax=Caulobacter flavus TaxID=1679497 RepID=A0A2N5CTR8_9CAUL|nr:hypothetical protein [Caulobacter flavus]AYV45838.1 hypothetical protein C1707_05980 [Caulobacter flavus]PLR15718.1 hypothetical protein CFHF_11500 [Caulobacter flavus]
MNAAKMAALLGLATMASGCVSLSRSAAVDDLPADWRTQARISEVRLSRGELKVTDGFDGLFRQRVQAKLDGCAKGDRALRLEARLDRFDKANPAMTALVGGANVLRGKARLVDVRTGKVVGDYAIGKTIVGSRLAVIKMGEAEEQLSDAFGEELCAQAFPAAVATR